MIYEQMRAIDPSLGPKMPQQCFDPICIAHLFRIPVEELVPWTPRQETERKGFSEEDRTNLSMVKLLLEQHLTGDQNEALRRHMTRGHTEILSELQNVLNAVEGVREEVSQSTVPKEWYSPTEVAELLGKAPFTVREWCRHGRVNVRKRPTGRGDAKEWEISRDEVERIRNHGLLPLRTKY
jgi:hypothetical protein